ncbi:MAG: amidohydrolase [Eubacteriales bacterium]|jgi:imidazolonepropionase-like amidohydrolase|nr:amidohydrolase [Eubacteriales bacterium]MDD3571413.1 amidohydrolase [Eubacteriales bacterium]MDD4134119.1 amidohydrolase [Eubacteriales bacterium]NLO13893.1 amidohydrolase [Clostridiales bacterium]
MLLIKGGEVHDGINESGAQADVLVEGGKIKRIAKNIRAPKEAVVVNARGLLVYPGFIDAHSHLGMDGYGIGYEGTDYNELNDIISPQLRGIDGFKPIQPTLREAALAGVTTVNTGPGSANVLGGTFVAVKTVGTRADDMVVKRETAMKCAFGENPKRVYRDKADSSRMTTAARLREMLFKAREYAEKKAAAGDDTTKQPAFDMKLEALLPVLSGEMPLKAHAHATEDIFTAVRIAREFGVKITLEHVTEGHLIAGDLVKEDIPLAVGPSLSHASKFELRNKTFDTPGVLARAGCQVSIITDAPVIPQEYLALCAALAVKSGMDPFHALQAITINPARHCGIEDRVGSLEAGKDADILLFEEDPFLLASKPLKVFVLGKEVK